MEPLYTLAGQREYYQQALRGTLDLMSATEVVFDFCVGLDCVSVMLTAEWSGHKGYVTSCAASPLASVIASGGEDGLKLWDIDSGKCIRTMRGHRNI